MTQLPEITFFYPTLCLHTSRTTFDGIRITKDVLQLAWEAASRKNVQGFMHF